MADFKLLPLGISDFRRIQIENHYVDKTGGIPKLGQVSKHPTENRGRFQVMRPDLYIATDITTRGNFSRPAEQRHPPAPAYHTVRDLRLLRLDEIQAEPKLSNI